MVTLAKVLKGSKSNLVSTSADEVSAMGMKNIYSMINYNLMQKNYLQTIDDDIREEHLQQ